MDSRSTRNRQPADRTRSEPGAVMGAVRTAGALMIAGLLVAACDDRQQRIEETAAPGMERDAAAPASGPVDLDVDTIQPRLHQDTTPVDPAQTGQPERPAPPDR